MPMRPLAGLARRVTHRALPRRSVRLRLTVVYGGLFLISGAGLLTVTYLLVAGLPPTTNQLPDSASASKAQSRVTDRPTAKLALPRPRLVHAIAARAAER